jgi:hypothetical protein
MAKSQFKKPKKSFLIKNIKNIREFEKRTQLHVVETLPASQMTLLQTIFDKNMEIKSKKKKPLLKVDQRIAKPSVERVLPAQPILIPKEEE